MDVLINLESYDRYDITVHGVLSTCEPSKILYCTWREVLTILPLSEASLKGALAGRDLPGLQRLGKCCDGGAASQVLTRKESRRVQ